VYSDDSVRNDINTLYTKNSNTSTTNMKCDGLKMYQIHSPILDVYLFVSHTIYPVDMFGNYYSIKPAADNFKPLCTFTVKRNLTCIKSQTQFH